MSLFDDAKRDAEDLAKLVNENTSVNTRYGPNPKQSFLAKQAENDADFQSALTGYQAQINSDLETVKESRGFRVVGTFASGFTYELPNDVGEDSNGDYWIYSDADSLPFTVPAATVPSPPIYTQVTFNDHNATVNRNSAGAHDPIYHRNFYNVQGLIDGIDSIGESITYTLGMKVSTGATSWRIVSAINESGLPVAGGLKALPLNGVWVDDFIDDRSQDSTGAFNTALSIRKTVRGTSGEYLVNGINVMTGMSIRGPRDMVMVCTTDNGECFTADTSSQGIGYVELSGFTAKAADGVAGAALIRQTSTGRYLSYCRFLNLETWANFETTFDGFFIFATWRNWLDGQSGVSLTTHQAIKSIPDNHGTSQNDTNFNKLDVCQLFGATHADGAIHIEYGRSWSFNNVDFELCTTRAVTARGVNNIKFNNCWFENVDDSNIVRALETATPQPRSCSPVSFDNCKVIMNPNNDRLLANLNSIRYSMRNCTFESTSAGQEVAFDRTVCIESKGNQVLSGSVGTGDFFDGTLLIDDDVTHRELRVGAVSGSANTQIRGDGFRHGRGVVDNTDIYELPASSTGGAFLVTVSNQFGTGGDTRSAVYMLRMSQDLSSVESQIEIANAGAMTAVFTVVNGYLRISGLPSGSNKVFIMACVSQ